MCAPDRYDWERPSGEIIATVRKGLPTHGPLAMLPAFFYLSPRPLPNPRLYPAPPRGPRGNRIFLIHRFMVFLSSHHLNPPPPGGGLDRGGEEGYMTLLSRKALESTKKSQVGRCSQAASARRHPCFAGNLCSPLLGVYFDIMILQPQGHPQPSTKGRRRIFPLKSLQVRRKLGTQVSRSTQLSSIQINPIQHTPTSGNQHVGPLARVEWDG